MARPESSPLGSVECGGEMARRQSEPLRSDAQLNRERILKVALEAFTESSTASLISIAKRAGLGIGTIYRHFPTREALVLEVYRNEVQNVVDSAPELLETMPPFDALRAWMELVAHYGMAKAGLADALSNAPTYEGLAAETYGPVIGALSILLEANERAGTTRANVDPDDVLLMMGFMWRIDPKRDWQAQSKRLLDILMDGLRAR